MLNGLLGKGFFRKKGEKSDGGVLVGGELSLEYITSGPIAQVEKKKEERRISKSMWFGRRWGGFIYTKVE